MTQQVQWEVLKASGRWRLGQSVTIDLGDALDSDGLGELVRVRDVAGAQRLRARFVPGPSAAWVERVKSLGKLGLPTITTILGVGEAQGRTLLFEPLPEGDDLRAWRARQPVGPASSLRELGHILGAVLNAMRHAHGNGIVHGALSAACVHVARDGVGAVDVHVGAFGILPGLRARRASVGPMLWDTLAPELTDDGASPTVASDLYAFGMLLVEMLTGSLHPRGTRHAWRELVARSDELRTRLRAERDDVPDALWDLAAGLLAAEPSARTPRSMPELGRALQKQSWETRPVAPRPTSREPERPAVSSSPTAPKREPIVSRVVPRETPPPAPAPASVHGADASIAQPVVVAAVEPPATQSPLEPSPHEGEDSTPPAEEALGSDTLPLDADVMAMALHAIEPAPAPPTAKAVETLPPSVLREATLGYDDVAFAAGTDDSLPIDGAATLGYADQDALSSAAPSPPREREHTQVALPTSSPTSSHGKDDGAATVPLGVQVGATTVPLDQHIAASTTPLESQVATSTIPLRPRVPAPLPDRAPIAPARPNMTQLPSRPVEAPYLAPVRSTPPAQTSSPTPSFWDSLSSKAQVAVGAGVITLFALLGWFLGWLLLAH